MKGKSFEGKPVLNQKPVISPNSITKEESHWYRYFWLYLFVGGFLGVGLCLVCGVYYQEIISYGGLDPKEWLVFILGSSILAYPFALGVFFIFQFLVLIANSVTDLVKNRVYWMELKSLAGYFIIGFFLVSLGCV